VAQGRLTPTPAGDAHLDHCLGCRRCEPVCPASVPYGELLVAARTEQAARSAPPARLRRAAWLLARPRLLAGLLGLFRRFGPWLPRGLRPALPAPPAPVALPAAATAAGPRVALFTGCIATSYESPTRAALARLLAAAGLALDLPAGQGCCGAAAAHLGDTDSARRLAEANRRAFAGQASVISLASGCQDSLALALAGAAPVEDALCLLDRVSADLVFRPAPRRVALHLPCTQRRLGSGALALRRLLARVPGLVVIELPDTGCCGAAGLHQLAEPERAAALRAPLLAALAESGAIELLSANVGCRLHLANGTTIPVRHPVEFLAEHLP
jgi:glycolate oxidase iron-sulfur subunit